MVPELQGSLNGTRPLDAHPNIPVTPWAIAHVSDVARGFVASLGNPRAAGNDYHLTSHEHTDWNGVYRALADLAPLRSIRP